LAQGAHVGRLRRAADTAGLLDVLADLVALIAAPAI
jgi:hypothetical protein